MIPLLVPVLLALAAADAPPAAQAPPRPASAEPAAAPPATPADPADPPLDPSPAPPTDPAPLAPASPGQAEAPAPPPPEVGAQAPPPAPHEPRAGAWFDEGHALVSEGLAWSVERLDRFFADEREVDLPRARSFLRWRNELTLRDDGSVAASTGVRGELRFPALSRRLSALRLTIAAGTTEIVERALPGEPAPPTATERPSAGLRLALLDTLLTQTDLQAGLLFRLPIGWYTRLRLRRVQPIDGVLLARMALSGFWQTDTGWGTRQDLDLERPLLPWLLVRLGSTGTLTERSRGWEWGSELAFLAAATPRIALLLGGGALGASQAGPVVETWLVHARVRRDVLRRWLFLEVEPGVSWKRPPGGGRQRVRSVILRLEIQFGAQERPLAPAAPPPAG